jgi:RNA polymerase sigma-70 factor (ECF subfamily)
MPKEVNETKERSPGGLFQTTHWTEIFNAGAGDDPQGQEALAALLKRYWKAVFCYLRCRGYEGEEAKDLTQGFFQEIVLGKGIIQQADRSKGRFRTFLVRCLDRYVSNVHRAGVAKQRMPEGGLVSLEGIDWVNLPGAVPYATPGEVFDYGWASALLDEVVGEVSAQCRETGNATHWEVFRVRVLQPILDNTPPPSLSHLCQEYSIPEKGKASKMVTRVKRLFRALLRCHVRQFVDSDGEVDAEIAYLMKILSKSGGRL